MYTYIYTHTYILAYVRMYIYIYISILHHMLYLYIYIYTHTCILLRPMFILRISKFGIRVKQILKRRRWMFLARRLIP